MDDLGALLSLETNNWRKKSNICFESPKNPPNRWKTAETAKKSSAEGVAMLHKSATCDPVGELLKKFEQHTAGGKLMVSN